jgi:hypothetical protein
MAVAAVVFNGTRVNSSDASTSWGNWGSSGGAPASESPIAYQGGLAVNKKINSSSLGGIDYDPGSGAVDMTSATRRLWFVKTIVSDSFDLNATYGVNIGVGSSNANFYNYNVAGSGANLSAYNNYPVQGGYLITAIDPNIAAWRESTNGTPVLTTVDWFGVQADFIIGAAKAENLALDAIDIGTGLTITAGDGASDEGTFIDFVTTDQGNTSNRWGVVTGAGDAVRAHGLLTVGTASVTEFLDVNSIVTFPDGYHSRGLVGVYVGMSNVSSIINIGVLLIGEGTLNGVDANDTRPDFTVVGTSGTFDCSSTMRNFRDVTFTSICDIVNADIECHLLVQASANISNTTIKTNSLTSVACLQDPTFGSTTDLHDVDFIQVGAGHAIEIDTAGSYDFNNLTFTGYGADTTDDAAIDVTETTGTVTINVIGGDTPTYKTAGATVVIVANPVTTTITVQDTAGTVIENARVLVTAGATGDFHSDVTVTITSVTTTATVTQTAHGLSNGDEVLITKAVENEYNGIQTISNVTTNTYDYTITATTSPATGTIKSSFVFINGLTNVSGQIADTRTHSTNQLLGSDSKVRKSSGSPYYKTGAIIGTTDKDSGLNLTVVMLSDE